MAVLHEAHNKRNESAYQKKRVLPPIDTRARIDRNEVAITSQNGDTIQLRTVNNHS